MSPPSLPIEDVAAATSPRTYPLSPGLPLSARTQLTALSASESVAAQNLDAVIVELEQTNHDLTHLYGDEDEDTDDESDDGTSRTWRQQLQHVRARMRHFLHIPSFHYTIICLVILDLIIVFVDLVITLLMLPCFTDEQKEFFQDHGLAELPPEPNCKLQESTAVNDGEWFLWALSVFLLSLFVTELIASGFAFGLRHFRKPIYAIDAIIVSVSLVLEVFFKVGDGGKLESAPSALIALRLWKIVRAVHAIAHSIELKNLTIIKHVKATRDQLASSYDHVMVLLEQQELKIGYLRKRVPEVQDEELDRYVEQEEKRKVEIADSEEKKEV